MPVASWVRMNVDVQIEVPTRLSLISADGRQWAIRIEGKNLFVSEGTRESVRAFSDASTCHKHARDRINTYLAKGYVPSDSPEGKVRHLRNQGGFLQF
jgi:hypothetical protein